MFDILEVIFVKKTVNFLKLLLPSPKFKAWAEELNSKLKFKKN